MSMPGTRMKQCHSQTVGHAIQHDWWKLLVNTWSSNTHFLLVMGWEVIDENFGQTSEAVTLTTYCWWDEMWLMGMPGEQMKQCHSQAVGHGMQNKGWDYLANKWSSVTYILLVMGSYIANENAWQTNDAMSLTCCWSWDAMWLMRMPDKERKQCRSLAVSHGMQHNWWECLANKSSCVTHKLLVMGCNTVDETMWQTNETVSLTTCWSWDET